MKPLSFRQLIIQLALSAVLVAGTWSFRQVLAEEVDLSTVARSIGWEPVWMSGEPQYCLFFVNPGNQVRFVVDGDDLYMDCNGNGDLTEPGEKLPQLELSPEQRRNTRNSGRWQIPDITGIDGEPLITNIAIDLDTNRGAAFGTKFVYFNSPYRHHVSTRPTFADNPAHAPILYPTSAVRLEVKVRPFLKLGAPTGAGRERVTTNAFRVIGQFYVDGLGPGTRFLIETPTLNCRLEFPLADGETEVKEMQLVHSVESGLNQSNSATCPQGVHDGAVKNTVSMPRSAHGLAVEPAEIEKPLAELRAVSRENRVLAVNHVSTREPLSVDADQAAATLAWHRGDGTVVFSSDRRLRATTTGNEQTVVVRYEESGETFVTFRAQATRIYSLAFSPDGGSVASLDNPRFPKSVESARGDADHRCCDINSTSVFPRGFHELSDRRFVTKEGVSLRS